MPLLPTCLNCSRTLTDPASQKQGFGPECAGKLRIQQAVIDAGRRAVASGFSDNKLRVMALVLKRREAALLLLSEDDEATPLQTDLIRAIRKELAARTEFLIRRGYLPPIESLDLAELGLSAKSNVAPARKVALIG